MMATAKQILIGAKELLEASHWGQGSYRHYDFRRDKNLYCSIGAIRYVTMKESYYESPEYRNALLALKAVIPDEPSIVDWNDHPDRTKDEVISAFSKAIELADDN